MSKAKESTLLYHLESLPDPRSGENYRHKFIEILFIGICAILSGCEGWSEMEDYAHAKKDWFKTFLELKNGIPSHDTFRRIFCILDFVIFQTIFINWMAEVKKTLKIKKDQVCIDGKTLRGTLNSAKSIKAIHMVNAWSTGLSMSMGLLPTDEKSNEITAIPELIKLLDLSGCLVSIDAIGCQTEITEEIVKKGGNFLLALKENQKGLFEATEELFRRSSTAWIGKSNQDNFIDKIKISHGREESRSCRVLYLERNFGIFPHDKWPTINSLIRIQSQRIDIATGIISTETRYYVSDAKKTASEFNTHVRAHWEVENKLHWNLDVSMNEDGDKKYTDNSAKNYSLLRQMALNLLRKFNDNRSIKRKQKMAAMDNDYILKVLFTGAGLKSYA